MGCNSSNNTTGSIEKGLSKGRFSFTKKERNEDFRPVELELADAVSSQDSVGPPLDSPVLTPGGCSGSGGGSGADTQSNQDTINFMKDKVKVRGIDDSAIEPFARAMAVEVH